MRTAATLVIVSLLSSSNLNAPPKKASHEEPVFRAPFVLKLRMDSGHYYQQKLGRVPYVADNVVYLFAGDSFGINAAVADGQISRITYQPNAAKADVDFSFTQQRGAGGFTMMLVIRNKLKRKLYLDALMTIPRKKGVYETDILPVPPNLSDYESWPHPIVQLVLRNFRFPENGSKDSAGQK